jgi:hypothetical protein
MHLVLEAFRRSFCFILIKVCSCPSIHPYRKGTDVSSVDDASLDDVMHG